MSKSKFWDKYAEVSNLLNKQAFIQMPGGQSQDKQAQDPAAMGGMPPAGVDPAAMGGMPPTGMDPAAMGGMPTPGMDPAAMGMDPSMMGLDPSMAGGMPAPAAPVPGEQTAAPGSPMITISLDQLFEIIQKVLGLAKKVGANGQGVQAPSAPAVESQGLTQDQLKATIYEALGSVAG